jgi:Peptidase family M28/PDZ domain
MAKSLKEKYPNVVTMINMDMIGRLNDKKELTVGGIGTCPDFKAIIEQNKPAGYNITLDESGIGPSDHTSFYLKDIPVLFFFTGTHSDYHKPSDDEDKINYTGVTTIVNYIFRVSNSIGDLEKVTFMKSKNNGSKEIPKYKVTLGIMPDYGDYGDGLHVDGVSDDRPASKAGIQSGDVIVKMGDCEIKEVYSYMACLAKFKSGETINVVYKRNDEIKTTKVTF